MNVRASGVVLVGAVVLLGGAWVTYASVQLTNTQEFCTSCHVMDGVTEEYRQSSHYKNSLGIQVKCADCHIPPGVVPTMQSKFHSLYAEMLPWIMGVDTPEEIEAQRAELARSVWDYMIETDSATCRSCHEMSEEALALQDRRAREQHQSGIEEGQTCIECHDDGLAHEEVTEASAVEKEEETDFRL